MYGELTRKPNGSLSSPARNLITNKKILKILRKFENLKIQCKEQHELNKTLLLLLSSSSLLLLLLLLLLLSLPRKLLRRLVRESLTTQNLRGGYQGATSTHCPRDIVTSKKWTSPIGKTICKKEQSIPVLTFRYKQYPVCETMYKVHLT